MRFGSVQRGRAARLLAARVWEGALLCWLSELRQCSPQVPRRLERLQRYEIVRKAAVMPNHPYTV